MHHEMRLKILDAIERTGRQVTYKNREWVGMKCPYCGDGRSKSDRKVHFNMLLSTDPDTNVILGNCFLPGCSLTQPRALTVEDFTDKFKVTDPEVLKFVRKSKNATLTKRNMDDFNRVGMYNINRIIHPVQSEYIKRRAGKHVDAYSFFDKFNLVTQLTDFSQNNEFLPNNTKLKLSKLRDSDYIGFINLSGSQIYVRNMGESREHIRLPLVKDFKNLNTPYIYTRDFDDMSDYKNMKIFLTEGIWNMIVLAETLAPNEDGMFVSAGSYKSMLPIFLYLSTYYYHVEWYFVLDYDIVERVNEKHNGKFEELPMFSIIKEQYEYRLKSKINIIYNTASNDVGDVSKGIDCKMFSINIGGKKRAR